MNKVKTETDNCRPRLIKYCGGQGLDLGCGFSNIKPDAIGIDLYNPNADMNMDARDLSIYPDNYFDFVYSSHLLEEIENVEATLREWLRVLKNGGHIVLYQVDKDYYPPLGDPACNKSHKKHFYWEELWDICKKISGVKLVHQDRLGEKTNEWSFELVVQKMSSNTIEEYVKTKEKNHTFSMNMIYWDMGDINRRKNVNFTWTQLKHLKKYLTEKGLKINLNLYDFSETKTLGFPETNHIPFDSKTFKKSWKVNRVIEKNRNSDFFCMFDSDVFFAREHFEKVHELLLKAQKEVFTVFNLQDLVSTSGINFEDCTYDLSKAQARFRHLESIGGTYIINTEALFKVGGFDERFIVWGGEDDDLRNRLVRHGLKKYKSDLPLFHLFHTRNMAVDFTKTPHYATQLHIIANDKTINRGFLKKP